MEILLPSLYGVMNGITYVASVCDMNCGVSLKLVQNVNWGAVVYCPHV